MASQKLKLYSICGAGKVLNEYFATGFTVEKNVKTREMDKVNDIILRTILITVDCLVN